MKKYLAVLSIAGLCILPASNGWSQNNSGSSWLKAVGNAAVQAGIEALSPQAKAVVDEANKMATVTEKENFIVTRAKTYMGEKNYELALQLGNYVLTNLNAKSLSAQKIVTDAKAALAQYAQDKVTQTKTASPEAQKVQQVQSDAAQTATGVKNLLGSFGAK